MATFGSVVRRGLPRVPGGEPWPPAGAAPAGEVVSAGEVSAGEVSAGEGASSLRGRQEEVAPSQGSGAVAPAAAAAAAAAVAEAGRVALRRGLPRVPGGEPWPTVAASTPAAPAPAAPAAPAVSAGEGASSVEGRQEEVAPSQRSGAVVVGDAGGVGAGGVALRRGLPRVSGGEPWPPAGSVAASVAEPTQPVAADAVSVADPTQHAVVVAGEWPDTSAREAAGDVGDAGGRVPLVVPRSVWPGRAHFHRPPPEPEPVRVGPFTRGQWVGAVVVGGAGLLIVAGLAVAFVRALLSLPALQEFLVVFPGEYHLPAGAPVGIPGWMGWQHFFNVFLMVLIIRSGLQIRTEKRPSVFWAPRGNKKGKTSLTIWFHQSLDILWLVNGVVFVVLLIVTGQWMRIVPTSWEVFPNAVSAGLQYVSLDWPTENGWVNYNALQQLAYFTTVFLAAPLAAVTGYRMSGMWPKNAKRLNAAYPVEWARKIHFPVMLYFVVFIAIHVFLVFATGALRNLNHMYAAQGSPDPTAYADNWTGFWWFTASLVIITAAWITARPLTLAPIARLFGTVSGR